MKRAELHERLHAERYTLAWQHRADSPEYRRARKLRQRYENAKARVVAIEREAERTGVVL